MNDREKKLFEVLKDHTIKNAVEVAHQLFDDEDSDEEVKETRARLLEAIERCSTGEGNDEDWDLLVEQTEM